MLLLRPCPREADLCKAVAFCTAAHLHSYVKRLNIAADSACSHTCSGAVVCTSCATKLSSAGRLADSFSDLGSAQGPVDPRRSPGSMNINLRGDTQHVAAPPSVSPSQVTSLLPLYHGVLCTGPLDMVTGEAIKTAPVAEVT